MRESQLVDQVGARIHDPKLQARITADRDGSALRHLMSTDLRGDRGAAWVCGLARTFQRPRDGSERPQLFEFFRPCHGRRETAFACHAIQLAQQPGLSDAGLALQPDGGVFTG